MYGQVYTGHCDDGIRLYRMLKDAGYSVRLEMDANKETTVVIFDPRQDSERPHDNSYCKYING